MAEVVVMLSGSKSARRIVLERGAQPQLWREQTGQKGSIRFYHPRCNKYDPFSLRRVLVMDVAGPLSCSWEQTLFLVRLNDELVNYTCRC